MSEKVGEQHLSASAADSSKENEEHRILRLLDHLRSLVGDEETEKTSLSCQSRLGHLAHLEARLLRENDVSSFDELGLPQRSLVAFVVAHAPLSMHQDLLLCAGEIEQSTRSDTTDLAEARLTASSMLAAIRATSPDASPEQLYAALTEHYGSSRLRTLAGARGLDSAAHVIDALCDAAIPNPATQPLPLMAACVAAASWVEASAPPPLPEMPADLAVAAILASPLLQDVEAATSWRLTFEPSHGSLRSFCGPNSTLAPLLLEISESVLIRVEAGALTDFRFAAHEMDATRAVAIGLYLCSQGVGARHELLRAEVHAVLDDAVPTSAITFTLRCLDVLPAGSPTSLLALVASLFLRPLKAVVPGAYRSLVAVADARQRPILHCLGSVLGEMDLLHSPLLSMHAPVAVPSQDLAQEHLAEASVVSQSAVISSASDEGAATALAVADAARRASISSATHTPMLADDDEPSCQEVCTSIARRFGCGIDAELDEAGQEALRQLRGVTMRSIQRLAAELYGGNAHFLLEIVQVRRTPTLLLSLSLSPDRPRRSLSFCLWLLTSRMRTTTNTQLTSSHKCEFTCHGLAVRLRSRTMRWGSRQRTYSRCAPWGSRQRLQPILTILATRALGSSQFSR